jgi:hypothetical protein
MHISPLSTTAVESARKRSCVVHVMQGTICLTKKHFVGRLLMNVITERKNAGTRMTWRTASNTLVVTTKHVVGCVTIKLGIASNLIYVSELTEKGCMGRSNDSEEDN